MSKIMQGIIVDNELNCIKNLFLDLESYAPKIEITAQFTNAEKALLFLKENRVDLVFLDIEMPEMSGLQLLDHFPEAPFFTVFTTAHSSYAIEAIKRDAVDYQLKPIDPEELALCMERLYQKFEANKLKQNPVVQFKSDIEKASEKIKIFTEGKIIFMDPDEILYCKAEGSYTTLFYQDRSQLMVSQNLKVVGEWLPHSIFIRVHHSYIVNRKKIKEFHRQENYLVLEDSSSVPVSRQRKNEILKLL